MSGSIGLKSYITGSELVSSLIAQCSWFIDVMPAIATLRANARRVTGLAQAIEKVQRPREFYRRPEVGFPLRQSERAFGLTVRHLELSTKAMRPSRSSRPPICASAAASGHA